MLRLLGSDGGFSASCGTSPQHPAPPLTDPPLTSTERLAWEAKLVRSAQQGDAAAFAALYRAYAQPIFARVLMPKLGHREAAEDALGETFRTAYEGLQRFEPRGTSIYHWLARIAANKAMDQHRARRVTGRALVDLESQVATFFQVPTSPDARLSQASEQQRFRTRLAAASAALNPRYRQAIELRFFHDCPRDECAEAMGVKVATFDVLLLRALKALRKAWEESETSTDGTRER